MSEERSNRADDLRPRLGRELDALDETEDALYGSNCDSLVRVVERLDFLEDSVAALAARDERDWSVPWVEVREPG